MIELIKEEYTWLDALNEAIGDAPRACVDAEEISEEQDVSI